MSIEANPEVDPGPHLTSHFAAFKAAIEGDREDPVATLMQAIHSFGEPDSQTNDQEIQ